ncbi:unnamed protein product [Blepharisma stoltei]|uniref:Transposase n=1 Tax=Blepharisma stoltei TaxID=1481888 RepID=A0AAU9KE13_9CILI|nr:unnamed protein product [Blepharisma stoltei]
MSKEEEPSQRVLEIYARLKRIKDELRPRKGRMLRNDEVPDHIKKEVCDIYNEHGGRHILIRLCNISWHNLKQWYYDWRKDRNCFDHGYIPSSKLGYLCKKEKMKNFKNIGEELIEEYIKKKQKKIKNDNAGVKEVLSADIEKKLEVIKAEISNSTDGIDPKIKLNIVKLAERVGQVKPIAQALGLSEYLVSGWKETFSEDAEEL